MRNPTWEAERPPSRRGHVGAAGWIRAVPRGVALVVVTFGCLGLLLLLRLVERPVFGRQRPWTPHIVQFVCRTSLRIFGIACRERGARMSEPGAVVANHSSWLDIFVLNAGERVYFVSKAEVARWPGIGLLARATGTVFIRRNARDAAEQRRVLEERLAAGHKLLFFPEGTSTDGLRVLPFKPTLFAALFSDRLREMLWVQPVTVVYHAPEGEDPRFYGWWGDMDFGGHLLSMLSAPRHGTVEVVWHSPLKVSDFPDRKSLALAAENAVRSAHPLALEAAP